MPVKKKGRCDVCDERGEIALCIAKDEYEIIDAFWACAECIEENKKHKEELTVCKEVII